MEGEKIEFGQESESESEQTYLEKDVEGRKVTFRKSENISINSQNSEGYERSSTTKRLQEFLESDNKKTSQKNLELFENNSELHDKALRVIVQLGKELI